MEISEEGNAKKERKKNISFSLSMKDLFHKVQA